MTVSKTITALIAAATIAGTGTLVYAQTAIDGTSPSATAPAMPGSLRSDIPLPADSARGTMPPSTLPSDATRSTLPDATLPADATRSTLPPQGGAITTPGYSSGVTTQYPSNTVTPSSVSSDGSLNRASPGRSDLAPRGTDNGMTNRSPTAGNAGPASAGDASTTTPRAGDTLPRPNRN